MPPSSPQDQNYPRIYLPAGSGRTSTIIIAALFFLLAAGISFFARSQPQVRTFCFVFSGLLGAAGVYCILTLVRFQVVLHADRIEILTLVSKRNLFRSDLTRWGTRRDAPSGYLVLHQVTGTKVAVPLLFHMDQAFLDWLAFIPNPEKSQYEELESQIIEDPNIGATAEGRTRALAKARRFAGILDLVFTVFLLWGLLSLRHRSAFIVMFAVLPWGFVVIASRSRGLFTIRTDLPFSDPHPSLAKPTVGPGLCLLLLSLGQHLLHWTDAIPIAAVTAIALWGAAVTVEPAYRNKLRSSMSFLFLVLPYGFGAVVNLNTVLDHSPAREFQTQVVSKPAQSGNNPRMLYLASWGPVGETREVPVGGSLYRSVEQGDTVCVDLRRGAFGITWYDVHACDKIE